jgi:hypothetical protein
LLVEGFVVVHPKWEDLFNSSLDNNEIVLFGTITPSKELVAAIREYYETHNPEILTKIEILLKESEDSSL